MKAGTADTSQPERSPFHWGILIACCVAAFARLAEPQLWMMGLDIPDSLFGTAWANYRIFSSISTLAFVSFIMVGGLLGDLFGRRRIFLIGLAGFILGNGWTLISQTPQTFMASRALTGASGALFFPLTLAVLRVEFRGRRRSTAMLLYTLVTALGALVALVSILVEMIFGGRATVVIPAVVALIALPVAWLKLPESRAEGVPSHEEIIAMAAWSVSILAFLFGLTVGWAADTMRNAVSIAAFGLSLAGIAGVLVIRKLNRNPGILRRVLGLPTVYIAVLLLISSTLGLALVSYITRCFSFFQQVQGHGHVLSGIALIPVFLGCAIAIVPGAWLAGRVAPRRVIGGGLVAMGVAMGLTALARPGAKYAVFIVPMLIFGFGYLAAASAWNNLLLSSMPAGIAGVTAGISRSAFMVGSAVSGTLLSLVLVNYGGEDLIRRLNAVGMSEDQIAIAVKAIDTFLRAGISLETLAGPPRAIGETLLIFYRDAYHYGNAVGLVVVGFVCLFVGALAWPRYVWRRARGRDDEGSTTPSEGA